ncbi:winged helix-turn-helix transcriptional regulator [Streptomyces sp. NPDC090445]|uniref:ArsR/SmtB family transcription factor n=1 Tax=Streptomyces sp. NPDC090445 TaxID=3365963 RepID=UPI0037F2BB83
MGRPTLLPFSADDLAHMRFAVSPMWQLMAAFRLLARSSDAAGGVRPPPTTEDTTTGRATAGHATAGHAAAGRAAAARAAAVRAAAVRAAAVRATAVRRAAGPAAAGQVTAVRATAVRVAAAGHPVHGPWLAQVRPRVAAAGLDRGWLAELIPAASRYAPDFLTPAPSGPAPALDRELAAITATPAERVRRDLEHLAHHQGRLGPRLRALHADPPGRLPRVAEEAEAFWELALAPYWARIRAVLEADVLHRARQAAEHGAARLLTDLDPQADWDGVALRLAPPRSRQRALSREAAGPGLLLIPSAFKTSGLSTRVAPPDPPQLVYPARGAGSLWETRPRTASAALAAVLGHSRSTLLAELDSPASTTELADRTGLSPARVSQCLTALRDAGLASAHRAGRSVLYARTAAAEALLAAAAAAASPGGRQGY